MIPYALRDTQTLEIPIGPDVFHADLLAGDPLGWVGFESELVDAGISIALPNRVAWAEAHPHQSYRYLTVRNGAKEAEAAVLVEIGGSRAVPGYRIARAERVDSARSPEGRKAMLTALAQVPRLESRILRLHVGLFTTDPNSLRRSKDHLLALGFEEEALPRLYLETLLLDLSPKIPDLFSGLHPTARRHIRAVMKRPVVIRPVRDPSLAPRLEALTRETFSRTGSAPPDHEWENLIRFSTKNPKLSRIVGLFNYDLHGPPSLLAFTWGCFHGDSAHYEAGASTRVSGTKGPLAYGLMWNLILWAKETGGAFFDLGGVSRQLSGPEDPRWGIKKFKDYFASDLAKVGAELRFEPNRTLGWASRRISSARRWVLRSY